MENLEEKVRDNEGLPIPMIVIYTNLDDLVKITVIENYIKEMGNRNEERKIRQTGRNPAGKCEQT